MSEQRGTLETLARHFVAALEPLRRAVSDENPFERSCFAWAGRPPVCRRPTRLWEKRSRTAAQAIKALSDNPSPAEIADLLVKTKTAYEKIRSIDTAPPGVDAGAFLAEIGERLFEILLTDYLAAEQTAIFNLLSIAQCHRSGEYRAHGAAARPCSDTLQMGRDSENHTRSSIAA